MYSVKNFDSKGYYTDVADKWPLTSTPKNEFYQKDGNYYFRLLTFPQTYVGGRRYDPQNLILK